MCYFLKRYPMVAGTWSGELDTAISMGAIQKSTGLFMKHAYSIIAVREVQARKNTFRMIKLRNPHGNLLEDVKLEWNGRWSDDSDLWAEFPEIKEELKHESLNDGTFWMCFDDFVKYFECVHTVTVPMPLQGCHPDKLRAMKAAAGLSLQGSR